MLKNNLVILVYCKPVQDLQERYPSVGFQAQAGEISLGILYLAGELERYGFDVIVRDDSIEPRSNDVLADEIASQKPLLVGFSVNAFNTRNVRDVARLVKENRPETLIVLGGPHVTVMPEEYAIYHFVDLIITHQGEITLRKIAESMREGAFRPSTDPQKKILRGERPTCLDDLALPARHLVDITKYRRRSYVIEATPTDNLCSSRGCPFSCTFCSSKTFWERRYFTRDPKRVVDEIQFLVERYGSRGIYFREDNFSVSKNHVAGICREIIDRGLKIKWECEARVDSLNKETLGLMKEAGCDGVWCGVESGSQRVLKEISKGIKLEQVRTFFSWCKEFDIQAGAAFMLGFPNETPEDLIETYEFAKSLPAKWIGLATYIGFPKSELYEYVMRNGLWEDRWEDVLVARNRNFTSAQLFALEGVMKEDFSKLRQNKESNPGRRERNIPWYAKRSAWYLMHPRDAFKRILALFRFAKEKKETGAKTDTFYALLERFSHEKHRSIVEGSKCRHIVS